MKNIALGCDHAGVALKNFVKALLQERGLNVIDVGCDSEERVDYPDYASLVAKAVQTQSADRGILICGTGIGMALTANRFAGVRAASLTDVYSAVMTRQHNDLNVLCLGARVVGDGLAAELVRVFLETPFEEGRHKQRVAKIEALGGAS